MKKIIMATAVLFAIGVTGPLLAQESKGPRIAARELKHDFGKVVQGEQVSHIFEVSNTGTEPLIIERVQTS